MVAVARLSRSKNHEVYEILTMYFGAVGLNRLYLGDVAALMTRLFLIGSAVALIGTAAATLSLAAFLSGAGFVALVVGLWVYDYFTMAQRLDRHEARGLA